MPVQRAGDPRRERLNPPLFGVRDQIVIPTSGEPTRAWLDAFGAAVVAGLPSLSPHPRWHESLDVDATRIRFYVVGTVVNRLGDYLGLIDGAIRDANEAEAKRIEQDELASKQVQQEHAAFDAKVDDQLARWAGDNPANSSG